MNDYCVWLAGEWVKIGSAVVLSCGCCGSRLLRDAEYDPEKETFIRKSFEPRMAEECVR